MTITIRIKFKVLRRPLLLPLTLPLITTLTPKFNSTNPKLIQAPQGQAPLQVLEPLDMLSLLKTLPLNALLELSLP